MNKIILGKCIVCGKVYEKNTERGCRGRRVRSRRKKNSVTCSPKCSRIFTKISQHIHKSYTGRFII